MSEISFLCKKINELRAMNYKVTDCTWPNQDELMLQYHNQEWGIPLHDERKLFEFLVLDAFQAGLSWKTILHKRENFRMVFDNFEPEKIALYTGFSTSSGRIWNFRPLYLAIYRWKNYHESSNLQC